MLDYSVQMTKQAEDALDPKLRAGAYMRHAKCYHAPGEMQVISNAEERTV